MFVKGLESGEKQTEIKYFYCCYNLNFKNVVCIAIGNSSIGRN